MLKNKTVGTIYEFDSSVIKSAMYNHETSVLTISFSKGDVYAYNDVEENVFNEFVNANSQGTFFTQVIKENYTFNKL
jgi:hypothetical protein